MENMVGMIKFTDFELEFLKKRNIVKRGNVLVNLNNGVPFTYCGVKKDKDDENVDRFIFKSNYIRLEFHRENGEPTMTSVFIKKKDKTYYAGEYYNCDMKKFGCKCDIDYAYKARIFGIHIKDYSNNRYHGYVSVEPKNNSELASRTIITKYVNGESTISPHIIESTKCEILDDTLHCHSTSECEPTRYLATESNFRNVLIEGINEEFRYQSKMQEYFYEYVPDLVETYSRSLDYTKDNIEPSHKK